MRREKAPLDLQCIEFLPAICWLDSPFDGHRMPESVRYRLIVQLEVQAPRRTRDAVFVYSSVLVRLQRVNVRGRTVIVALRVAT